MGSRREAEPINKPSTKAVNFREAVLEGGWGRIYSFVMYLKQTPIVIIIISFTVQ